VTAEYEYLADNTPPGSDAEAAKRIEQLDSEKRVERLERYVGISVGEANLAVDNLARLRLLTLVNGPEDHRVWTDGRERHLKDLRFVLLTNFGRALIKACSRAPEVDSIHR
jgi:hypothetical protein